jgi:hypothetical protein
MAKLIPLLLWLLAATPEQRVTVSEVPCKTADDCWLDPAGRPIPRPKAKRGRQPPRGDCGNNLMWLRTRLRCENQVCVAVNVGDRC